MCYRRHAQRRNGTRHSFDPRRSPSKRMQNDTTAIRDLVRQQEIQFDAINSRITSLASGRTRQNDPMCHPFVAALLTELQTFKCQCHVSLPEYSSRGSDTSHMTPQRVIPDEDDSTRALNAPGDTHCSCSTSGCLDLALGTSLFCTLHML